jgi:hypothetical protein
MFCAEFYCSWVILSRPQGLAPDTVAAVLQKHTTCGMYAGKGSLMHVTLAKQTHLGSMSATHLQLAEPCCSWVVPFRV